MICSKCGTQNAEGAQNCAQCGQALQVTTATAAPDKIPNYLVPSILVTLFCCLPGGIAAIVYASQVKSKVAAGDIEGAMKASKSAKMWCWIAFGVGLPLTIIYIIVQVLNAGS